MNRALPEAMSTLLPLLNYLDSNGAPVCPACGRAILTGQPAMRIDDCMIHVACLEQARETEEPCAPSP